MGMRKYMQNMSRQFIGKTEINNKDDLSKSHGIVIMEGFGVGVWGWGLGLGFGVWGLGLGFGVVCRCTYRNYVWGVG